MANSHFASCVSNWACATVKSRQRRYQSQDTARLVTVVMITPTAPTNTRAGVDADHADAIGINAPRTITTLVVDLCRRRGQRFFR